MAACLNDHTAIITELLARGALMNEQDNVSSSSSSSPSSSVNSCPHSDQKESNVIESERSTSRRDSSTSASRGESGQSAASVEGGEGGDSGLLGVLTEMVRTLPHSTSSRVTHSLQNEEMKRHTATMIEKSEEKIVSTSSGFLIMAERSAQ
jgi:hypothetical protein